MQEEIVNNNAMDKFVAFTMVQQIMTGLSSAASEEEKVSIITKCVFSLLKRNGGIGRQAYELRKQMQALKIDVALFSETHLKPHMRFYIPNYHIYWNDRLDGNKVGTALAVKKESHILTLTCLPSFH
jgi:hypothetical protein